MTTALADTTAGFSTPAVAPAGLLEAAADHAAAVDAGERSAFRTLTEEGGTALTLSRGTADLRDQVAVLRALGARCVSTAFSLWGHRMGVEYLDAAGAELPPGVAEGTTALSSAMAPLFKAAAGLGEVPVEAAPTEDGGLSLTGRMPWASNLLPGGEIVLPARLSDGSLVIALVPTDHPQLSVRYLSGLTALDSTASGSLQLEGVEIGPERVLTRDTEALRRRVTVPFLGFQSAFCLGLSQAALDAAGQALQGPESTVFGEDHAELTRRLEELTARLEAVAADPQPARVPEVVSIRLEAAHLTGDTTSLERRLAGGRGFALRSATSRRVREAEFLPVQSPTEGHLRVLVRQLEDAAA